MRVIRALTVLATLLAGVAVAHAQVSDGVIKIGVLNDQSSLYADLTGQGSVVAARMAVEDFGADKKGMKVEIIFCWAAALLPLILTSRTSAPRSRASGTTSTRST